MKNKTILFGGSGLLGSTFLKIYPDIISVGRTKPTENNAHIHIDSIDDLSILDGMDIDNVIFLIGNSNHHMLNKTGSTMLAFDYNVLPMKKALDYFMLNHKLKSFVFFTTILLYGNEPKGRPVNEKDKIYPYTNEYVFSKHIAEGVGSFYYQRGMPIINCRISNIYGSTTLDRPDLIPTLIKESLTKDNITVWSKIPIRDFIYANDACEAVIQLIESGFTGIVNLGTGTSVSVGEVCNIITELSGKIIHSLDKEVTGVMEFCTDITLIKNFTNWTPRYTLHEGLTETFIVMKEHLDKNKIS